MSQRIIADHRASAFAFVNGPPNVKHGHERDQPKERPHQEIEAIRQVVLNPDINDMKVLFHRAHLRCNQAKFICSDRWRQLRYGA